LGKYTCTFFLHLSPKIGITKHLLKLYLDVLGIVDSEVGHHDGVLEILGVVSRPVTAQAVEILQNKIKIDLTM
jgi:hypothetical protein